VNRRGALPSLALVAFTGCQTKLVQTAAEPPPVEAGTTPVHHADAAVHHVDAAVDRRVAPACGATIASRVTVTPIDVAADVRYRRLGYNLIPEDDRIAFSVAPDGAPSIAWREAAGTRVHVTALDGTLARRGADTVVDATDIGGLVAQRDGAALLVTSADPGEPLQDPANRGVAPRAAVLVRIRGAVEAARVPLTGTSSVTTTTLGAARDCIASPLNGRLEWNGAKYGAYFAVHGCQGDAHASFYGDKLVYLDDGGRALPGGWTWGCSIDEGLRLLPGATAFTPICLSDGTPNRGLNLVVEGKMPQLLAAEFSVVGYSAGTLGSLVATNDGGFVVVWSSRGVKNSGGQTVADRSAPDIAFLAMDSGYRVTRSQIWLTETPDVAELGVHLAPYGPDRFLLTWEAFGNLRCGAQTCEGTFQGTHARLLDATGRPLSADETIAATPNELEDIRPYPDGDLGFAFVDVANRDRAAQVSGDGGAPAPPVRTLQLARIAYCP
jgi:hypothetical protein